MRRAVTTNVVPAGRLTRFAVEAHRDVLGLRERELEPAGRRTTSAGPARAFRCTGAGPTPTLRAPPSTSRHRWRARRGALRGALRGPTWPGLLPSSEPGTFSPSGPPKRQAAITSAVTTAIATSASTAMRDSRPGGRDGAAAPGAVDDDVVLADREPGVVLVDERLPVEAERLGVRAEEAADVRGRGQDVEELVLERPKVLRA